jgi:DNA-binding MarR family transcriptional regulator
MQHDEDLTSLLVEFHEKFSSWEHGVVRGKPLTLQQIHAMEILCAHGRLTMKELAEKMGVTTGSLTVLVDRLEKKGIVERQPHESDRRSIRLGMTAKGEQLAAEHHDLHLSLTRELTACLSPEETNQLINLLRKMLPFF